MDLAEAYERELRQLENVVWESCRPSVTEPQELSIFGLSYESSLRNYLCAS